MPMLISSLLENSRLAFFALRLNVLRSVITVLGVIVGVAMVITMGAIGSGARQKVEEQIKLLGLNVLVVVPAAASQGGYRGRTISLTDGDLKAIKDRIAGVEAATGLRVDQVSIVSGRANWSTMLQGVDAAYSQVYNIEMKEGRFFDEREARLGSKFVVLSATVAEKLFGNESALDRIVRVGGVPMKVVGVRVAQGQFAGQDMDDGAFAPLRTARSRLLQEDSVVVDALAAISVKFASGTDLTVAQQKLETLLRQRKNIPTIEQAVFRVINTTQLIQLLNATQLVLSWLIGAAGAISLIVGGVGVMNIMLVSVAERTQEIGLRMAVGAHKSHIMTQFLMEAIVLCLFGGVIGIVLGVALAYALAFVAGWPVILGSGILMLATGATIGVGLIFGYFPALRAASLNPIDALRYE